MPFAPTMKYKWNQFVWRYVVGRWEQYPFCGSCEHAHAVLLFYFCSGFLLVRSCSDVVFRHACFWSRQRKLEEGPEAGKDCEDMHAKATNINMVHMEHVMIESEDSGLCDLGRYNLSSKYWPSLAWVIDQVRQQVAADWPTTAMTPRRWCVHSWLSSMRQQWHWLWTVHDLICRIHVKRRPSIWVEICLRQTTSRKRWKGIRMH